MSVNVRELRFQLCPLGLVLCIMFKKSPAYVEPKPNYDIIGEMSPDDMVKVMKFPEGLSLHDPRPEGSARFGRDCLRNYSIVSQQDVDFEKSRRILYGEEECPPSLDSCLGMVLGNAVGDALGAPMEFRPVQYDCKALKEMGDEQWDHSRFFLKPGQWTDDNSMQLCIADCLLVHGHVDCKDLRLRFLNWWEYGYNNAFAYDEERRGGGSIGLGGNISMSFGEFKREKGDFTTAGDTNVSGNGSVMRNGAVPCRFWNDTEKAMQESWKQSRTTHQGTEAAELCRLMSFVCTKAAQMPTKNRDVKEILSFLDDFQTDCYSVACLAKSKDEEAHESNEKLDLKDRKWNWKQEKYRYCSTRAKKMPGYIGSYAMDGVCMSLHVLWTTTSFKEAMLKIVNMCGDADSVGAVVGQMAGAIYGIHSFPRKWLEYVEQWDRGMTALKAYKLWAGKTVTPPTVQEISLVHQMDKEFFCSTVKLEQAKKKK